MADWNKRMLERATRKDKPMNPQVLAHELSVAAHSVPTDAPEVDGKKCRAREFGRTPVTIRYRSFSDKDL
ncbi:MAG TPA: hypothetical protein VKD90_26580 [Gemmataceae bacterium]|nr:hypothetical protein [Gemmataceae bacterium]